MTVRSTLDAGEAPEIVGRNAYRIVQEGLTNARKHARDTAVNVSLCGRPGDGLEIEIRNPLAVGRRPSEYRLAPSASRRAARRCRAPAPA